MRGGREGRGGAAHTHTYLQRDGVGDLAIKHEKDGELGVAGPGLAKEVDGLLIER